ncbi:hypothetical protein H4R99_003802 [Coemansia sp. RSA 1722]|nr:hypothetical protein LPJ57_007083 [Coemansia sp. RSA 486]KAJ2232018.1 hypothetical protein IWW45_005276 [Coemansia sp. RSA 485]KAJ2599202.1 hypothetical protein H4R99_003802 [Coemansia sp. RSA 1722]
MDDTAAKLFAVIGDKAVETAGDLVVALSQAVLLDQGFQLRNNDSAVQQWSSPGLPQSLFSLHMVRPENANTVEFKWVSVGQSVVLLFAAPDSSVCSVELKTSKIVRRDSQFPLQTQSTGDLASVLHKEYLTSDAWDVVAAAIRAKTSPKISSDVDISQDEHQQRRGRDDADAQTLQSAASADRVLLETDRGQRPDISVGGSDLDPFGSMREGDGGGMHVGPDHPMFRRGYVPESPSGDGPQRLPRGAVPPGARFDPISPFGDRPGPLRPSGGHGPGGRGFFSGEPDPDNMQPPNSSWNYYM